MDNPRSIAGEEGKKHQHNIIMIIMQLTHCFIYITLCLIEGSKSE